MGVSGPITETQINPIWEAQKAGWGRGLQRLINDNYIQVFQMVTQATLGFSSSGMCKDGQKLAWEQSLLQEAGDPLLP